MVFGVEQAVSKFGRKDAAKITKDILVFLPSFTHDDGRARRGPRRADELLRTLLGRAASSLKEDLAPGRNPASLDQSRLYLELSDFLCRESPAAGADPVQLLRFYCMSSLMGKMTLGRLSEAARLFFVVHLARALSACALRPPSPDSSEAGELASMRRQVVDALTIVLRVRVSHTFLHTSFFFDLRAVFCPISAVGGASMDLVRNAVANVSAGWWAVDLAGKLTDVIFFFFFVAFDSFLLSPLVLDQRKEQQTNWNVPPPLHAVLVEIARLADEKQTPESKRVADLSRVRV